MEGRWNRLTAPRRPRSPSIPVTDSPSRRKGSQSLGLRFQAAARQCSKGRGGALCGCCDRVSTQPGRAEVCVQAARIGGLRQRLGDGEGEVHRGAVGGAILRGRERCPLAASPLAPAPSWPALRTADRSAGDIPAPSAANHFISLFAHLHVGIGLGVMALIVVLP